MTTLRLPTAPAKVLPIRLSVRQTPVTSHAALSMSPQDVIIREEDCDVQTLNFDREWNKLVSKAAVRSRYNVHRAELDGSILEEDVMNRRSGEILLVKGKTLDASDVAL